MKFSIYQESRQGGRANNEDRIAYCYSRDALFMVVADGMGGHSRGEVAARIAVQAFTSRFRQEARPRLADPFRFLEEGLGQAHQAILDHAVRHGLPESPRTTCVACIVQDNIAYWAHAGDSRLLLLRRGRPVARTKDHSRVRLMIDEGLITEAQAASHPDRNKIYSCLGSYSPPEIDFSRKTLLERGDVLLLCTDGLWGMVSGEAMAQALKSGELTEVVPDLLSQAEARAGRHGDNLSVVAVRWEGSHNEEDRHAVSTLAMPIDQVTSRFEGGSRPLGDRSDLSDEDIEKAIREIRAAIDKYNPQK